MNIGYRKIGVCCVLLALLAQTAVAAVAAAAAGHLTGVRFSQRAEAVRIVFDLDRIPAYQVRTEAEGRRIVIELPGTQNQAKLERLPIKDDLVRSVVLSAAADGALRAVIELSRDVEYKVNTLGNPNRLYIDLVKNYDRKFVAEIAPGLKHITLLRGNAKGALAAHILDVDPAAGYRLRPLLANGRIAGREVLSAIAARGGALGAVNASYFALSGELLGLTKIDSTVVSTTYLARSAFGMVADAEPVIGQVDYNGTVSLPDGSVLPVSGVNTERGENGLVLYNAYYSDSTKTNAYGMEYAVKDGVVVAVQNADTALAPGVTVVSAHGTTQAKLANVKVGDRLEIREDLGEPWNRAAQILGAGPMLVKAGSVYLTTKQEEFSGDVAAGRAPRTAVGITKDKHVLLVVVDGRQSGSIGCTLLEMALLMQELGAVDAMNLDGGGSSEMVVGGEIVNNPSDGAERKIGSALAVVR